MYCLALMVLRFDSILHCVHSSAVAGYVDFRYFSLGPAILVNVR